MTAIILYAMAALGAAYIVGKSEISFWPRVALSRVPIVGRWIVSLIECPVCFGFWFGIVVGFFADPLDLVAFDGRASFRALVMGLITAGMNLILSTISGVSVPGTASDSGPSPDDN